MDIIDTSITPDPFNPQPGDVYEYDAPAAGTSSINIGGGASCMHSINVSGTARTRVVVTGISDTSVSSARPIMSVNLEINGQQKSRESDRFQYFIASLSGCAAVGRVMQPASAVA